MTQFKALKSFVAEEDYDKFLDILVRCYDGTIKNDVSVLNICGGTGKSSLVRIIQEITRCSVISYDRVISRFSINALQEDGIVYFSKYDSYNISDKIIRELDEDINNGLYVRELYKYLIFIKTPATVIVTTNTRCDDIPSNLKRKVVNLHLSNSYRGTDRDIIEKSVEEFHEYLRMKKAENARKATLQTINVMGNFLYKDLSVLLGKYVYDTRTDESWLCPV